MRGKPKGKSDCVYITVKSLLDAGYSPNLAIKINRKWFERINQVDSVQQICPMNIETITPKEKIQLSIEG